MAKRSAGDVVDNIYNILKGKDPQIARDLVITLKDKNLIGGHMRISPQKLSKWLEPDNRFEKKGKDKRGKVLWGLAEDI